MRLGCLIVPIILIVWLSLFGSASCRQGLEVTAETENEILIKAVRVNTLSKLTFSDTHKFLALIGDVFPGVTSADITGGELEAAIKEVSVCLRMRVR